MSMLESYLRVRSRRRCDDFFLKALHCVCAAEVVLAAAAPMTWQPPSKNTCDLIKNGMQLTSNMCTGCGAAPLHLIQGNAFYNVEVQSPDTKDSSIFLHSAVTVVKGLEKSKWALVNPEQPEGACKVSTKARMGEKRCGAPCVARSFTCAPVRLLICWATAPHRGVSQESARQAIS